MFYRLFYPRQSCFLTASHEGKSNATLVDWLMPASVKPPMVAVSLNAKSFSLDLLSHAKEFCICVLPEKMEEQAVGVGSSSGRQIDKIDEYNIKLKTADSVSAPLVVGALASVECRVVSILGLGDHAIVVGEVVETHFPDEEQAREPLLFNWGSKNYFGLSKENIKEKEGKETAKEKEEKKESKEKEAPKEEKKENKESGAKEKEPAKEEKKENKDKEKSP